MASTAARRFVGISMVSVIAGGALYCCKTTNLTQIGPVQDKILGFQITNSFVREAQGGGFVTVDVAVKPGGVPSWNVPPVSPDTIGYFSNRGEGAKREKRYGWKPNIAATYDLVLSNDGSGRTKWTMFERNGGIGTPYKSGHLWQCETTHDPHFREMGFKNCGFPVTYDPGELASLAPASPYFFASFVKPDADDGLFLSPAAWISCTTGCCSLGT